MIRRIKHLSALAALALATSAQAQQNLALPAGEEWTHRQSGIAVPISVGGIARTRAQEFAPGEQDIAVQFSDRDGQEAISFYIFRNTNGNAALWFAQAQGAIEARPDFATPTLYQAVRAFSPPGQSTSSGLVAVYSPGSSSTFRGTGVALLPVGDWYVKVRASSKRRSAAEVAGWIDAVLADIRWPAAIVAAPAAEPITDCPNPLVYAGTAKAVAEGSDRLAANMAAAVMATGNGERAARWCRDVRLTPTQVVYRPDGDTQRYQLAFGDNGNAIIVGPALDLKNAPIFDDGTVKSGPFSVALFQAHQTLAFANHDSMPSPQQAVALLRAKPVAAVTRDGNNVKIQVEP
jgi:hypothetical protein